MDFSERLIAVRREKGLSQEALAEALGVSRQAVSKWETGESKPDVNNLIALCDVLELNIEYLCLGKESAPTQEPRKQGMSRTMKVFLSALVAALCLLVGAVVGIAAFSSHVRTDVQTQTIDMANLSVKNVQVERNFNEGGYDILVTPGFIHEGVEVKLYIESVNSDYRPMTIKCQFDGFNYMANFGMPRKNVQYRITAVFYYQDMQKQVPILDFHADEGSCSYVPLWNQ